jgi:hypothetical protein
MLKRKGVGKTIYRILQNTKSDKNQASLFDICYTSLGQKNRVAILLNILSNKFARGFVAHETNFSFCPTRLPN